MRVNASHSKFLSVLAILSDLERVGELERVGTSSYV